MCIYIYLKIFTVYIYDHFDSFLPEKKVIYHTRHNFLLRKVTIFKNFGESLLSLLVIQNTYLFAKPEITKAQRKFIIQDEKWFSYCTLTLLINAISENYEKWFLYCTLTLLINAISRTKWACHEGAVRIYYSGWKMIFCHIIIRITWSDTQYYYCNTFNPNACGNSGWHYKFG